MSTHPSLLLTLHDIHVIMLTDLCYTAFVTLSPFQRIRRFENIECPGDIIIYNCFVGTNAETVELIWQVTFPEMMPMNITIVNGSNLTYDLGMSVSAIVVNFGQDVVESMIRLTVLEGVNMNETELLCRKSDINETITTVFVDSSGTHNIIFSNDS